jgi:glutaredoxin-like protein NrdH
MTKRVLNEEGIRFEEFPIEEHREKMIEMGYLQAPVVVAGEKNWSGFSPDRIRKLAG